MHAKAPPADDLGLCDTHVHVFDPARFPFDARRKFTPGPASVAQLRQFHDSLGVTSCVLVQPSVYGIDHGCLLDGLSQLGDRARGVAVLGPGMDERAIALLAAAGTCGTRVNLAVDGCADIEVAGRRVEEAHRLAPLSWHLQIHASLPTAVAVVPRLLHESRTVVLDHHALLQAAGTNAQPGWRDLLAMMRGANVAVKLSAPYMASKAGSPYLDLRWAVEELAQQAPGQLLWGSNWPHTHGATRDPHQAADAVETFRQEDDGAWLGQLQTWLGPDISREVFRQTPQRIYRFTSSSSSTPPPQLSAAQKKKEFQ